MDRKQTEAASAQRRRLRRSATAMTPAMISLTKALTTRVRPSCLLCLKRLSLNRPKVLKLEPVGPLDAAKCFIESLWPTDEDDEPAPAPARRKRAKVNPAPAPARRGRSQRGASQRFSSRGHDDDDGSSKQPFVI